MKNEPYGFYAYTLDLEVQQIVYVLKHHPTPGQYDLTIGADGMWRNAATWSTIHTGIVGIDKITDIKPFVSDNIDEFVNDYLAANPPREATISPTPISKP